MGAACCAPTGGEERYRACRCAGVVDVGKEQVGNREHFSRLLRFCSEVMAVCAEVGITPVLSGSLAVLGYAQDSTMEIHDIDLACSELEFARLGRALQEKGIHSELRLWHVLQVLRDDLKVEFGSMESGWRTCRRSTRRGWSMLSGSGWWVWPGCGSCTGAGWRRPACHIPCRPARTLTGLVMSSILYKRRRSLSG